MEEPNAPQHRLLDRFEIQDVIYRWCRAVDRCDWTSIPPLFHPDATDDHGGFYSGDIPGLVKWLAGRHQGREVVCQHSISNMLIEFAGPDLALVESYLRVFQHPVGESPLANAAEFVGFGRYIDRFERRAGEWKIAARTLINEMAFKLPVGAEQLLPDHDPSPGGKDFLQHARDEMGISAT